MSHVRAIALHSNDGNRIRLAVYGLLALSLALSLFLGFAPIASAKTATVQVMDHPELGKILTDGNGMTLYLFTKDSENTTVCYDQCAVNWPPLLTDQGTEATAGANLPGKLGTITRKDGSLQVTYNGIPLYYWAKDTKPGDATGQNVGDVWYVVHPNISSMTVSSPVVNLTANSKLGNVLTNQGMTLYLYTKDTANVSNCVDKCAAAWPPLLANGGAPVAGKGLTGKLGTIDRADGTRQVTYNGIPLYFYIKDVRSGDATGQDVGEVWYAVYNDTAPSASGVIAEPAAPQPVAQATAAPAAPAAGSQATATPVSVLPVTGGSTLPWATILLGVVGAALLLGGIGLTTARSRR